MHFDEESVRFVLLLKIVNFKRNCSFESFSSGERLPIYNFLFVCSKNCSNAVKKKTFDQNILEEDMRICLTSVQELAPVT